MSLMDLLQDCGDDDDAGSDMDVCIGSDPPAAVPAVFGGTNSLPAGGTSLAPQEDEAQGAGDEARGAMDGTLDPITNAQSKTVSGGDGIRPLREAAEQGETSDTPQRAEGGAAGPAPPEASGRTPTAGSPAYSAEALSARLAIIPLEGSVDDVAAAVVEACQEFGAVMRRCDSKKSKKEAGGRLVAVGLACKHAMPNRQKEYRQGDAANGAKKRKSSSQRTNCNMKVYVRWPVQGPRSDHPYLAFTTLEHDHPVSPHPQKTLKRRRLGGKTGDTWVSVPPPNDPDFRLMGLYPREDPSAGE
ncbi:unnamed protein product [Ectocarpus sp. CCAP 1310/34]|nr:unnamed protein product [Ectocarpus sp. CCAP 1310/34]